MKHRFSAMWTEQLGKTIRALAPTIYTMELVGADVDVTIKAVNQGIDAHLQACFVPDRGDSYVIANGRLRCKVSGESLPVLVRRLMEDGGEHGELLASSICETIGIELV